MTTSPSAIRNPHLKVWRFVAYGERFGFDGGRLPVEVPQFVKWYINAWSGAGGDVLRAVNALRAEKDFLWLQGAVVELLTAATNTPPHCQGYLLSPRKTPATSAEIGSILRVDGRKALAVLGKLDRVGLLERAPWPPGPLDGDNSDNETPQLLQNVAAAAKKGGKKGGKKGPGRPKNKEKPLKAIESAEAPTEKKKIDVEGKGPPVAGQGDPPSGADLKAWEAAQRQRLRPSPATTPPMSTRSTKVDGGVTPGPDRPAGGHPDRMGDPPSFATGDPAIVPIGQVYGGLRHRYSAAAGAFAEQVMTALRCRPGSARDRARERGHWTKAYEQAAEAFESGTLAKVVRKVLRVAETVGQNRSGYGNPEGYVQTAMTNEIRDRRRAGKAVG